VNHSTPDEEAAAREQAARRLLTRSGAEHLPRPPWLHRSQPPSSVDLVRLAVWRGQQGRATEPEVRAGLALLAAARAEVDQLETGMLFTARGLGLSWSQISREMGLWSAQASVQRFDRLTSRVENRERR
jgi:hypothetical protein